MISITAILVLQWATGAIGGRELKQAIGPKILDGENAGDGEFPYVVSLRTGGSGGGRGGHYCGGTLIDSNIVLTAAHCLQAESRPGVHVGSVNRNGGGGQTFQTLETSVHPNFKQTRNSFDYDVALILIDGSAPQPTVSLESSDGCFVNEGCGGDAVTVGWGLTNEKDPTSFSDTLQKVSVPPVQTSTCKELLNDPPDRITARMICAGRGGPDSCRGDSGGPILMGGKQIGVTSFGDSCGVVNSPGVYASVPAVLDWIFSEKEVLKSKAAPVSPPPSETPSEPSDPSDPPPDDPPPPPEPTPTPTPPPEEPPPPPEEQKEADPSPTPTPPPPPPPPTPPPQTSGGGDCVFRNGVFVGNCK